MAAPAIHVDPRDVLEAFRIAPERMRAASREALLKAGFFLEGEMRKAAPVKTGQLRARIGSQLIGDQAVEAGVLRPSGGKPLAYALIQHDGGTIKGKPWLVFPPKDSPLRTPSGVGGIRARQVRANPGQFGYVATFPAPRDNPRVILGRREDGETDLLFIIRESVTLKGSRYVQEPFERNQQKVLDFVERAIAQAVAS